MSSIAADIDVRNLRKAYDEVDAVRGVSFTVAPGEVFGFLGPNGAGKSTTIKMLCTLTRPTSGTARVSGTTHRPPPPPPGPPGGPARGGLSAPPPRRDDVRRHIGLVFQDPTLD